MKILLVSPLPPPIGGIAIWTERFLSFFKDNNDVNISLVNLALNGKRGLKSNNKTSIFDEICRTKRILFDMHNQVKNNKPTIVHLNTSCGPYGIVRDLLCILIAKRKKIPVVLHFHCNVENQISGRISTWALKKMIIKADKILVLNSESKAYISKYASQDPEIVPNFISQSFLIDSRDVNKNINKILYVGNVQFSKGTREIFAVAKAFPHKQFVLIGPVADEIATLPCPPNVLMMGSKNQNEVKKYMLDSDLFLFPSYTEGFSLSLTEAMATGLPTIATDVGANKDMLENKGGRIVPVKNTNSIIEAIIEMDDYETRKRMSEWEISKVKNCYLINQVVERLLGIYKELENK